MLALLATLLLTALAPPDTSLDDMMGRWEAVAEATIDVPVEGASGPDTVTIRTVVAAVEIRPDTLVWTGVSAVSPPHGDGRLAGSRTRTPYRADGLTLHLPDATLRLGLDGEHLVVANATEPSVPPQRYRRAAEASVPDALVGLWATTVRDDAGVPLDIGVRIRAEGTMQILRDDPLPILVLGPYLLQPDPTTRLPEDPTGIVREVFVALRIEVDGDRLTWTGPDGEAFSLARVRERAPRRAREQDGE